MADNITVLDSAEVEKTIATKELAGAVHANKIVMIDENGHIFGYHDDEIIFPVQVTEDIFHYAVHEGVSFSASVVAVSGDLYICFKTPNTDNYLHLLFEFGGEGNCHLDVYEGVTPGVGGSDQVVYNKNRAAAMNGGGASAVLAGNTDTVGSIQVGIDWTGGTLINPQGYYSSKSSNSGDASHEFVLEKNTTYGFHLVNTDNKDAGMILTWFEVPINP